MYNIALVCNFFPKLSETFIYDYIKLLMKNNIHISVFPIEYYNEVELYDDYNKLSPFVKRFDSKKEGYPPHFPKWVEKIIKLTPNSDPGRYYQFLKWFPKQFKDDPNRVIHVHFLSMGGALVALMKNKINGPKVLELHGLDIYGIARKIPTYSKKVLSCFDAIIVNCKHMEHCVKDILNDENLCEKVFTITHGIDITKAPLKFEKKYLNNEKVHIVSVGRLVEKKGVDLFLKSIPYVLKDYPNLEVTIVGEGPLKEDLESLTKKLRIDNIVKFSGYLKNKQVFKLLKSADIFVLPCREAKNGDLDSIPSAIQEAELMKVPVVSTRVGGIPEIVDNNISGYLVEPENVSELSKKITKLCENEDLRKKLGDNGRKKVLKELDMNKQFQQFQNLYKHLFEVQR